MSLPQASEIHSAIADAHGISLYQRYSEADAAGVLDYSIVSLRRIRTAGRIGCIKLSPRKIAYFGYQLVDFLLQAVEEKKCPDISPTVSSNSATSGSQSNREAMLGAGRGSTPKLARRDALASAQRILRRPSKN